MHRETAQRRALCPEAGFMRRNLQLCDTVLRPDAMHSIEAWGRRRALHRAAQCRALGSEAVVVRQSTQLYDTDLRPDALHSIEARGRRRALQREAAP